MQKNSIIVTLILITVIGAFLRLFMLPDTMHYELDQARDFRVITQAVTHGVGELPLQGPKAAGNVEMVNADDVGYGGTTTLRLGPLFYYIEYVSALIFGNTPYGSIMLIVLLSIATIPAFFFLVKVFFGPKLALGLTAIVSFSLFFVTYSRFGWNPNLMPLFMILTAICLLRATNTSLTDKQRGVSLVGAAASLAFLVNMHFLAFTIVPVICVLYLLWTRPRVGLTYWTAGIALFLFLNTPLIINDVKTGGENTKALLASVVGKGSEGSLIDNVAENITLHTTYQWIIVTGDQGITPPKIRTSGITCEGECKKTLFQTVVAGMTIIAGAFSWVWFYKRTTCHNRRNFLRLIALWWSVTFIAYIPLSLDAAPRFFLLQAPLFVIIVGFVIHAGIVRGLRKDYALSYVIIVFMLTTNTIYNVVHFQGLVEAQVNPSFVLEHPDRILKEKTRVTLAQMEKITDRIEEIYNDNNFPVFLHAQAEYKRALWERIDQRSIPRDHIPKDFDPIYADGNYFLVVRSQSDQEKFIDNWRDAFDVIDEEVFGTLILYQLQQKESFITERSFTPLQKSLDPRFSTVAQPRYLWRQVFSGCRYNFETHLCE